MKNVLLM